jgi:hypothetical protein
MNGITMRNDNKIEQKLSKPAHIVHIAFPILCWALVILRWCGVWFTLPLMTSVIIVYYVLAAAYLFFTFIIRMKVIAIIGLLLTLAACFYLWIPYNWIFTLLLIPAIFTAFYKRGNTVIAAVLTILVIICTLIIIAFSLLFDSLVPEKYAYHISPDGHYATLEYAFTQLPGGTDVYLCHVNGPLMVSERILYLAKYSDYGSKIEWLDDSNVYIYDRKMDVFRDPVIENYTAF